MIQTEHPDNFLTRLSEMEDEILQNNKGASHLERRWEVLAVTGFEILQYQYSADPEEYRDPWQKFMRLGLA
jgi:hypothetical protein